MLSASTINVVSPGNDLQLITGPAASATCIEYQVPTATAPQPLALRRRSRAAGSGITWPAWRTLLTALSIKGQPNGTVIPNPAGANPFVANAVTASTALGSINVTLQGQNGTSPVVQLTTTVTGEDQALVDRPLGHGSVDSELLMSAAAVSRRHQRANAGEAVRKGSPSSAPCSS